MQQNTRMIFTMTIQMSPLERARTKPRFCVCVCVCVCLFVCLWGGGGKVQLRFQNSSVLGFHRPLNTYQHQQNRSHKDHKIQTMYSPLQFSDDYHCVSLTEISGIDPVHKHILTFVNSGKPRFSRSGLVFRLTFSRGMKHISFLHVLTCRLYILLTIVKYFSTCDFSSLL
jgi:hypothetical protein